MLLNAYLAPNHRCQPPPLPLGLRPSGRAAAGYLTRAGVTGTVQIKGGDTLVVTVSDSYTPIFLSMLGVRTIHVTGHSTARLVRAVHGTER